MSSKGNNNNYNKNYTENDEKIYELTMSVSNMSLELKEKEKIISELKMRIIELEKNKFLEKHYVVERKIVKVEDGGEYEEIDEEEYDGENKNNYRSNNDGFKKYLNRSNDMIRIDDSIKDCKSVIKDKNTQRLEKLILKQELEIKILSQKL
jgi:hypothetical protein